MTIGDTSIDSTNGKLTIAITPADGDADYISSYNIVVKQGDDVIGEAIEVAENALASVQLTLAGENVTSVTEASDYTVEVQANTEAEAYVDVTAAKRTKDNVEAKKS